MGIVIRTIPIGRKFLEAYPKCKIQLQKLVWLKFFEKFQGGDVEVTKGFAKASGGVEVDISNMRLKVT